MTTAPFDPSKTLGWDNPNLDAPVFARALNGLDQLLYYPFLIEDDGVVLLCQLWPDPYDHDYWQSEVQPEGSSSWIAFYNEFFEVAPTDPQVRIKLPLGLLPDGRYALRFRVRSGEDGDYRNFSRAGQVVFDSHGPYANATGATQPPDADYPPELPGGAPITQMTLDANPGGFEFLIPSHAAWEAGDTISAIWWRTTMPVGSEPSLDSLPLDVLATTYTLPISAFDGLPDGFYHLYYQLTDFAGNKSLISTATTGRDFQR